MTFTDRVRDELAHAEAGAACCRRAELSAALRLAGALHLRGVASDATRAAVQAQPAWVVNVSANAVARRLHRALHDIGSRPSIEVHEATPLQPRRYRLTITDHLAPVLEDLGVTDLQLRPVDAPGQGVTATPHDAAAYVRGALMTVGSLSDPRKPAHLELRAPTQGVAATLRRLLMRCGGEGARIDEREDGWRVSCKSGAAVGSVLARAGAHTSFLEWDAARLRRELRSDANRAANADRANLGRAAGAAARQVAEIEVAVARAGWDALPDDLRATALTRLANPEASLSELASLHEPPVTKATVHRRLARLADLGGAGVGAGEE